MIGGTWTIAQVLMTLTALGMGWRSFNRHGRPLRAAVAAMVGYLLWPVMAVVLLLFMIQAAMPTPPPPPTRSGW